MAKVQYLFASLLLFSLTACGGTPANTTTTQNPTSTPPAVEAPRTESLLRITAEPASVKGVAGEKIEVALYTEGQTAKQPLNVLKLTLNGIPMETSEITFKSAFTDVVVTENQVQDKYLLLLSKLNVSDNKRTLLGTLTLELKSVLTVPATISIFSDSAKGSVKVSEFTTRNAGGQAVTYPIAATNLFAIEK